MPNQIILAWTVDTAGSSIGPVQAASALAAVALYSNAGFDPILGQFFGLTVADDATTTVGSTATRTLTLNMTSAHSPTAPPPFPGQPNTAGPPALPYALVKSVRLPGTFAPKNGVAVVPSSVSQIPSIVGGGVTAIQFDGQLGVYYPVVTVNQASITLSTPYTGTTGSTGASKQVAAPVKAAAVYSSSVRDTAAVTSTAPSVPAGSGAQAMSLSYMDSTGAGPFTVTVPLTGKRPSAVALHAGSVDIAVVTDFHIETTGAFGNSVGQITLSALTGPIAAVKPGTPIGTYLLPLTDQAQLQLGQALAYLPPSFFALAQPGAAAQALPGICTVTTGSVAVPTSEDLTSLVSTGSVLQFAVQPDEDTPTGRIVTLYPVAQCTPKLITLQSKFTGMGPQNLLPNGGTLGLRSTQVQGLPSAATLFPPSASVPTNAQLAALLAEFVDPTNALPPPNPPLAPMTIPPPTLLSGIYARTLQLALAVPVVSQPIAFA
jgi:hypothetical protein